MNKGEKMDLFHIPFKSVKQFILRIPQHRIQGENNTVKRICFSENVKKAINASPCGGNIIKGMLICRTIVTPIVHMYVCNTKDNPEIQFIQLDVVYNRYHVRDAEFTREWWALGIPKMKHFIFYRNIFS